MIFESGPETRIRLRKGDLEKLGIKTEGQVLSGRASVADAFDRQARRSSQLVDRSETERLRAQWNGERRR